MEHVITTVHLWFLRTTRRLHLVSCSMSFCPRSFFYSEIISFYHTVVRSHAGKKPSSRPHLWAGFGNASDFIFQNFFQSTPFLLLIYKIANSSLYNVCNISSTTEYINVFINFVVRTCIATKMCFIYWFITWWVVTIKCSTVQSYAKEEGDFYY